MIIIWNLLAHSLFVYGQLLQLWVIQACMFCLPNVRHVIIFLGTVSFKLRLYPVHMYA